MTDTPTPPTDTTPSSAPKKPDSAGAFNQANITTGLALLAVILAGAPYVVPQVQAYLVGGGMKARPAILMDASKALQAEQAANATKEAQASIAAHHDSIFNDKTDPTIGTGPIKVVEFLDYQCAYCRAATPAMKQFLADNPDVTLVVKEYPVVHPPSSRALAAYALAAFKEGKYAGLHYALLTDQISSQDDMNAMLEKAGVDPATAHATAVSKPIADQIDKTIALGSDLAINGTPTFIVGDRMVNGADIAALTNAVAEERAKLKKG